MLVCVCVFVRACAKLITVPEAYCNYSLDVCLQALSPCRVGLMPAMLALVYVAVWIDPQPRCRAQRWPTSCCKHLRHHTAACVPVCIYTCSWVRVRVHALHVLAGASQKLKRQTGHLRRTTPVWLFFQDTANCTQPG